MNRIEDIEKRIEQIENDLKQNDKLKKSVISAGFLLSLIALSLYF